jgi:hypothetical protein
VMRRGLVGKTSETGQNGHNFWYDRWIALKCLHEFLEAVFLRVALDSLLDDEDVWSPSLEYRVKRVITINPTVGSRLNFYTSFRRPFSLWLLWNRYSVKRRSCRLDLSSVSKEP